MIRPRASLDLARMAQATAYIQGLDHVRPTHVFHVAIPVLAHRLSLHANALAERKTKKQILTELFQHVSPLNHAA